MSTSRLAAAAVFALGLAVLAGCTTISAQYDQAAAERGLQRRVVVGQDFQHVVFERSAKRAGDILHIYLEGDGSPLLRRQQPTQDPTPRRPVMPALLALDPAPAAILGRPCYHGLAQIPPCQPRYWTDGRFGPAVVDSMSAAAAQLAAAGNFRGVVLIGHSGGGVLALLMAQSMTDVQSVIAVASVADADRWAAHHGLAPLHSSLNPARQPRSSVPELFIAGQEDRITPLALTKQAVAKRPQAALKVFPGFDHACCWSQVWRDVLSWGRQP